MTRPAQLHSCIRASFFCFRYSHYRNVLCVEWVEGVGGEAGLHRLIIRLRAIGITLGHFGGTLGVRMMTWTLIIYHPDRQGHP